jgi:hypothetical protein
MGMKVSSLLRIRVAEETSKSGGNRCRELRLMVQAPRSSLGAMFAPQPVAVAMSVAESIQTTCLFSKDSLVFNSPCEG